MSQGRTALLAMTASLVLGCSGARKNLRKADNYLDDGRWSAALRTYQQVLEKYPGEPRALVGVATAWIASGQPEKALVPAKVAAEVEAPGAVKVLAQALLANGRGAEAVAPLLGETAHTEKVDAVLTVLLAEAHLAAGDISASVSAAEAALPAGGEAQASALAAWAHWRAGTCDRATHLAGRAMTAALTDAAIQAEAAAVFAACADPDQAGAAANTARALIDEDAQLWFDQAARFSAGGDTEGSLRRMSWLRATFPKDGRFARELGGLWMALGDAQAAESAFSVALTLAPYADGARVEGIRFADRRADALTPEQRRAEAAEIWRSLAGARAELGDKRGAAKALNMAAQESRSTDPEEWTAVALAWLQSGQAAQGMGAAQRAVELRPDHVATQRTAADIFSQAGDVGRAIGHARVAWELDPMHLESALQLIELYLSRAENREARRVAEIALSHHPGNARLREALRKAQGY